MLPWRPASVLLQSFWVSVAAGMLCLIREGWIQAVVRGTEGLPTSWHLVLLCCKWRKCFALGASKVQKAIGILGSPSMLNLQGKITS